jgi:hypothetical protein
MRKLIIDEGKEAERIIEEGFTYNISYYELSLLAKYYRSFGLGYPKIREELINICNKHFPYFREVAYDELLDNAVKSCKDNLLKKNVEYVIITKSEVETIKKLPHKYGKILFFMLVIAKKDKFVPTKVNETDELKEHGYFYNCSIESAIKATKLQLNKNQINHLKYYFDGGGGYLSAILTNENSWRICFADDNSEPCIVVSDFENILDFFPYFCSDCGRQYFSKAKRHDLCEECYGDKRKETINNSVKNYRNRDM